MATAPTEDFSDFPAIDHSDARAATATPVAANQPDVGSYLQHIHALIDANATADQVRDYVKSQGADASKITGLDEAIAAHKLKQQFGVTVEGAQPTTTEAPKAAAEDFNDFPTAEAHDPSLIEQAVRGVGLAGRGALRGFGQLTDLVSAPLKAVQDIGNMIAPGYIDPAASDKYTAAADNVGNSVGLPTPQNAAERVNDAALAGATGGLMTAGGASLAAPVAPIAKLIAGAPGLEMLGGAGGGAGGQIAKEEGAGPVGQFAAALAGGVLAPAATAGTGAAARRIFSSTEPNDLLAAFDRQGVPMLPADSGGSFIPKLTAGTGKLTLGGIPIEAAAARSVEAAHNARTRIADAIGNTFRTVSGSTDGTAAGQAAQRGVKAILGDGGVKQTTGQKLYSLIPIAGDQPAVLNGSRKALAELNEGLSSNEELSKLISDPRLQAYERAFNGATDQIPTGLLDMSGNPITRAVQRGGALNWKDLQSFRSYVGELAGRQTLQDSTSKAALQRLYAGLSEDMRATAQGVSPAALAKFTRANNYWRALQSRKEEILKPLLGNDLNLHGEAAFKQIERWAAHSGNSAALARTLRSMPEEEANSVRATIFDRLGAAVKSKQNGEGSVFSPSSFVQHWNGLSSRAKSSLFPGADYRQSIDDLVRIANAQKSAESLGMGSPTAHLIQAGHVAGRVGGFVTSIFTNPLAALTIGADVGGELAVGKLLASPRFARWLSSAPAKPNAPARLAHINRLSAIAQAEPAIANEVLALQQRLASAFAPQSLAAQPEDHKK